MKNAAWLLVVVGLGASLAAACGDDDADDHDDHSEEGDAATDAGKDGGGSAPMCTREARTPAPTSCEPNDGDYAPCTADGYAACVSDDGEYHRIQESISTIARVAAFEDIAELL